MKAKARKFRGYAPVRAAKGFGPRHVENAKEGDLTKVNTDTVPAMLTPREAILNRNAAEMAGRGNIEKLNAEGNKLARKGVDLAQGGDSDVGGEEIGYPLGWYLRRMWEEMRGRKPHLDMTDTSYKEHPQGDPYVTEYRKERDSQKAQGQQEGTSDMKEKPKKMQGGAAQVPGQKSPMYNSIGGGVPDSGTFPPQYGRLPAPPQQVPPGYLPAAMQAGMPRRMGMQGGASEVGPQPIGSPNPQQAYGPPVQLSAPDLSALLAKAGKEQGLSASQIAGLTKAFSSFGGGGGSGLEVGAGTGNMDAVGAFAGGISDIGYPPFVAPGADYHADKGGWLGPYDPAYTYNSYARGIASVPFR